MDHGANGRGLDFEPHQRVILNPKLSRDECPRAGQRGKDTLRPASDTQIARRPTGRPSAKFILECHVHWHARRCSANLCEFCRYENARRRIRRKYAAVCQHDQCRNGDSGDASALSKLSFNEVQSIVNKRSSNLGRITQLALGSSRSVRIWRIVADDLKLSISVRDPTAADSAGIGTRIRTRLDMIRSANCSHLVKRDSFQVIDARPSLKSIASRDVGSPACGTSGCK